MRCQNTYIVFLFLSNLQIYDFFAKNRNDFFEMFLIPNDKLFSKIPFKKPFLRNIFPKRQKKLLERWLSPPPKTQSHIV